MNWRSHRVWAYLTACSAISGAGLAAIAAIGPPDCITYGDPRWTGAGPQAPVVCYTGLESAPEAKPAQPSPRGDLWGNLLACALLTAIWGGLEAIMETRKRVTH